MRVPGYCTSCRRPRTVRVSGHGLAMGAATRGVYQGICSDCERREDESRHAQVRCGRLVGKHVILKLWHGPDVVGVLVRIDGPDLHVEVEGQRRPTSVSVRDVKHAVREEATNGAQ